MTQRWFTSDPHIRHDLVVRERGFWFENADGEAVVVHEEYERRLAENWDRVVKKDDMVFVLGDIAMNPNKGAFDWFDARPGRIHLISGNHDAVHPMHSSALKSQRAWLEHFETISPFLRLKFNGVHTLLSHFPYQGEGERGKPDRHVEYRLRNEGMPLIHGHVHSQERYTSVDELHVGLDAWGLQLVPEEFINSWVVSREQARNSSFGSLL